MGNEQITVECYQQYNYQRYSDDENKNIACSMLEDSTLVASFNLIQEKYKKSCNCFYIHENMPILP